MKLSHSLGQVLLKDKNYIRRILDSLDINGETVLEIGSGPGEISEIIAQKCAFLHCVEFDPRFVELLLKKFSNNQNVKVVHSDILKFDISVLNKKMIVFGNVPYQISNSLIEYLVRNRTFIKNAYLTFQKEFVDKVIACPSTKDYSYLSCFSQYYAKVEKVFDIPKGAFNPIPKVDSSFIKMEFYSKPLCGVNDERLLFKIIRQAFNQRRKKILNSLSSFCKADDFFKAVGINSSLRAENVSLEQYAVIANRIHQARLDL